MLIGWLRADSVATNDRGWAYNLAIFRIVFLVGAALPVARGVVRWTEGVLPGLPLSAWEPVSFYALLPLELLANAPLARALAIGNVGLIVLGALGVRTRWTLGLATVVSLYVLGLPMNQGKVDHTHHLVWFIALLAVGPSARFLSVDAVRDAVRAADRGVIEVPPPAGASLLTFRYVWALFGLIYLAPGLAKLERALTAGWADHANLQAIIYARWLNMALHSSARFMPPVWIANLPTQLLTLAGMAVVAFEIGFIALVWMRPIRPFLGLAGLAFHRGSRYVLGISFSFLTPAYAGLFDWSAIGRGLTRRLGGEPLLVFYDGHCRLCRRAMALLRSVDLFDAIEPVPADDPRRNRHPALTDEALAHDLHAVGGGTVARGYEAYLRIAGRLPLLWPAALLMRLPAVAAAGRRWYRRVSDSRACAVARPARQPSAPAPHRHVVAAVGVALVAGQAVVSGGQLAASVTGAPATIARWSRLAWPFDHYPRFTATRSPGRREVWQPRVVSRDRPEVPFPPGAFHRAFGGPARSARLTRPILALTDTERRRARSLDLLRALWPNVPPGIQSGAVEIRVYAVSYRLAPPTPTIENERLLDRFSVDELTMPAGGS